MFSQGSEEVVVLSIKSKLILPGYILLCIGVIVLKSLQSLSWSIFCLSFILKLKHRLQFKRFTDKTPMK